MTKTKISAVRNLLRVVAVLLLPCAPSWSSLEAFSLPIQTGDTGSQKPSARDGQHDFDFNIGVWHTHIRRILDPLSGGAHSIELNGTVTVRKVWDGRAELEEI